MVGGQGEDSCGNSGRASSPDHASKLFVFGLDSFRSVPSSFHYDCS
ncbi:hypothetical protein LRO89_12945 [Priestia megaterium]